jgi:hypothetical protein
VAGLVSDDRRRRRGAGLQEGPGRLGGTCHGDRGGPGGRARGPPPGYATYLKDGGDTFAAGTHTTKWRSDRTKTASRPGLAQQYIDEPLASGDYAPVALRTTTGGALVFFTTRHYQKQTAAQGVPINVTNADVKALMTGEPKQSLTLESISNQAVLDPAKDAANQQVEFLGRIQGLTAAKGE